MPGPMDEGRELWEPIHPLYEAGQYQEAIERGLEILTTTPNPMVYFNVACCESLAGQKTEALGHLRQAIDLWEPLREQARGDADLDPIRDDPEFQALTHLGAPD